MGTEIVLTAKLREASELCRKAADHLESGAAPGAFDWNALIQLLIVLLPLIFPPKPTPTPPTP